MSANKIALGVIALTAALTACAAPATETGAETGAAEPAAPQRIDSVARPNDPVQRTLDALVAEDGFPGAMAAVLGRNGRTRDYTAGVGNLRTGAPVPANGQVRIASNTKMFTATVLLQLVGEGKVALDEPVETYLPGIVRGEGIDGRDITVRQLLQHTSGLPDYDEVLVTDYFAVQHKYFEPRQLVEAALTKPAQFPPGGGFAYSNTNYVLVGLVVQKVTGRPIGEQITERVITPLKLRQTYWPEYDEQTIRGKHPHAYWPGADGKLVDVTEQDSSMSWAAGQLVSTPRDLNTFLIALLDGQLLEPELLEQMKTTVAAPDFDTTGTARYGLGIGTFELSCGGVAWNHGGTAPGFTSSNAVTEDGRAVTVVVNSVATSLPMAQHIEGSVDAALCGKS